MYSDKQNASYFQYLQTNLNKESKAQLFPFTRLDPAQSYYCCQTGIADFIYKDKLSFSGYRYQELFPTVFYPAIQQLFSRFHAEGFSYLVGHTHKEIVIVFQPFTDNFSPLIFADEVDQLISKLSEEYLPLKNSRYCNATTLSTAVSGIDGVQIGCEQTEYLKRLSFFRMTPGVLTAERLASLKNHATYRDVMTLSRSLCQACTQGEDTKMIALAEKLFLDLLKHSYDMELVRDTLSYIKQFLSIRLSVHLPKDDTDLTALCSASSYIIIEECYETILPVLTQLCHAVQHTGAWSDTVAYAAYFLRSNISKDVSLPEIAAFADTTPAYLSNLFHQQTGMTIKQYQQKIRMEYACHLLETADSKVTDIATQIGFSDRRYFTKVFKETYGVTPQEYRQQHI